MIIRQLVGQFHTAEAICEHLASAVTKTRAAPVTYNDLVKEFGTAKVKELDAALKTAGLDWMQRSLAGTGVDLADAKIQSLFTDLTTAGTAAKVDTDKIKKIGVSQSVQWEEYGFPSLPTIKEIQDGIDGLGIDGQAISVAISVTPQGDSLALSVTSMAGRERVDVIHGLVASSGDDPGLSEAQRAFVTALFDLVKSYKV